MSVGLILLCLAAGVLFGLRGIMVVLLVAILLAVSACSTTGDSMALHREDAQFERRNCVHPNWWDDRAWKCRRYDVPIF